MDDEDMKEFSALVDEDGEISKTDLIVHTKASKFWKPYMEAKSKPGGLISKVGIDIICYITFIILPPMPRNDFFLLS